MADRSSSDDDADESKSFLGRGDRLVSRSKHQRFNRPIIVLTVINLFFLLLSATLFTIWVYNTQLINTHYRKTFSWSPLYGRFDLNPSIKMINGTLFPPRNRGIARQMPNPAADKIWNEWELTRYIPITSEQIVRFGKDPSTAVKFEDKDWGFGSDAYVAIFDVYHQIHCLNTLRKMAYSNYYNMTLADATRETKTEVHVNHCVDILLQALQCSGNLGLITYHWVEAQARPFPDMSINKQCVDFDSLTQWRKDNTVNISHYDIIFNSGIKPQGIKQLPAPNGWFRYFLNNSTRPPGLLVPDDPDFNL